MGVSGVHFLESGVREAMCRVFYAERTIDCEYGRMMMHDVMLDERSENG